MNTGDVKEKYEVFGLVLMQITYIAYNYTSKGVAGHMESVGTILPDYVQKSSFFVRVKSNWVYTRTVHTIKRFQISKRQNTKNN